MNIMRKIPPTCPPFKDAQQAAEAALQQMVGELWKISGNFDASYSTCRHCTSKRYNDWQGFRARQALVRAQNALRGAVTALRKIDEEGPVKSRVDEAWQELKHGLVRGVSIGWSCSA